MFLLGSKKKNFSAPKTPVWIKPLYYCTRARDGIVYVAIILWRTCAVAYIIHFYFFLRRDGCETDALRKALRRRRRGGTIRVYTYNMVGAKNPTDIRGGGGEGQEIGGKKTRLNCMRGETSKGMCAEHTSCSVFSGRARARISSAFRVSQSISSYQLVRRTCIVYAA